MPKKTKREKIIADYRKKIQRIHLQPMPASLPPLEHTYQLRVPPPPSTRTTTPPNDHSQELVLIKRDITKTIFFALLAVSVEFGLYWFWKR